MKYVVLTELKKKNNYLMQVRNKVVWFFFQFQYICLIDNIMLFKCKFR